MKKALLLLLGAAALGATATAAVGPQRIGAKPAASLQARAGEGMNQGTLLYENFADATGMASWVPLGWQNYTYGTAGLGITNHWLIFEKMDNHLASPVDGKYFVQLMPTFDQTQKQDEWLVMPELTPRAGDKLAFYVHFTPIDFYKHNSDDVTLDWDLGTVEWVKQTKACNFEVMVSVDGGDFVTLHDFSDDYMGIAYNDIPSRPKEMERKEFALTDYVGKNIRLAFHYSGTDGTAVLIDAVRVGYDEAKVSYLEPASTLYYGLQAAGESHNSFPYPVAIYPVFSPVTWTNTSEVEDGSFLWAYMDPLTNDAATSSDRDLTLTYYPDYSSERYFYNNFFAAHVLHGGSASQSVSSYSHSIYALQAGGSATYLQSEATELEEAILVDFGMLPFSPTILNPLEPDDENIAVTAEDYGVFSEAPVFGHGQGTAEYWADVTGKDGVQPAAIFNRIHAGAAPLVVKGAWLHAYGTLAADAEFTLDVFKTKADGSFDGAAIASVKITGAQVLGQSESNKHELCMPFSFDKPLVLSTAEAPSYAFRVSGFNSDKVSYWMPMQTKYPDALERNHGFVEATDGSIYPMSDFENDFGRMYGAFAISLDACYPWLETTADSNVYVGGESTRELAFESWYDAADFVVDAPEWLEVTASGSRDKCVLSLRGRSATFPVEGTMTVSVPGYSKTFKVHQTESGIAAVEAAGEAEVTGIYTVGGAQLAPGAELAPGLYIVRYSDGRSAKKLVK